MPLTCVSCGQTIRLGLPNGRRVRRFCSLSCRDAGRRVEKTCRVCHKRFTVAAVHAERYTVCSLACKRRDAVYGTCVRCGSRIPQPGTRFKHCSEACRRPPRIYTCATCGRRFRRTPSAGSKFCSSACYFRFRGETSCEAAVRCAFESIGVRVVSQHRVGKWVFDLLVRGHRLLIDVDGTFWHRREAVQRRDARKTLEAKRRGFRVERVPESIVISPAFRVWLRGLLEKYRIAHTDLSRLEPEQAALPLDEDGVVGGRRHGGGTSDHLG